MLLFGKLIWIKSVDNMFKALSVFLEGILNGRKFKLVGKVRKLVLTREIISQIFEFDDPSRARFEMRS